MNKRNIFLWSLYDFANSVVMIVFFLYFSQWLVVDHGVSDFAYNAMFIFSTLLLIVTAPVISLISDRSGKCFQFLKTNTVIVWVLFIILSCITLFMPDWKILAMIVFVIGNFTYQLSFSFYIPLLNDMAPVEKRGLVSGIGNASNWLGQIVGLIIVLPFANGHWHLIGEAGRAQTFLPATFMFIILSLPMLLFYKNKEKVCSLVQTDIKSLGKEYKNIFKETKILFLAPGVFMFLLAFFFFNDAILTAQNNFPIVMQKVFNAPDGTKTMILVLILLTSSIGSFVCGWLGDKFGLKKVLLWIIAGWVVIMPLLGLSPNIQMLTVVATIMGILFGGVWAVSRAYLSKMLPEDRLTHGFSFYVLSERFASFLGPLTWAGIVTFAPHTNGLNYRIAMVCMTVYIIIGFIIVKKIKN